MAKYARVDSGTVMEIIGPIFFEDGTEIPIAERFTPDFVATLVDITNASPSPQQDWTYNGSTFSQPA
ncbi:hypothetical protein [Burkholderia sp. Ac-20353]|uniref:hypothetical protein n=1 Tax=Burkholderia sp. Ac-20353 TaxID=2703894 RepID=UPI00197B50D6|nr:hypothetical protein [Burkholderia sp. Ac-20353]MBN3788308.1 hypothetical protein [Burkholderia sp. Ac-20353]